MAFYLGGFINLLGSLLNVVLGLVVLTVGRRQAKFVWFGVFTITFGLAFVLFNVYQVTSGANPSVPEWNFWVRAGLRAIATIAAALTAYLLPRAVEGRERTWFFIVLGAAFAWFLVAGGVYLKTPSVNISNSPISEISRITYGLTQLSMIAGMLLMLGVLAARVYVAREPDPIYHGQCALIAASLTLYVGFIAGGGTGPLNPLTDRFALYAGILETVALLGCAALWLLSTRGVGGRRARNLVLLTLGMPIVGFLALYFFGPSGSHGVARTVGFLILTYAILRYELLGLTVKVRFAVKHSTLAAIFIAVFFVATEAAQQFLGEETENAYLGIAAAGLLVFAIAPLQRLSERLAQKAVPEVDGTPPADAGPAALYRRQASLAWMDGAITRREGLMLKDLRESLGRDAEEARRIDEEMMLRSPRPRGRR